jgi:hypothetical protein
MFEPLVPGAHKVPNTNFYRAPEHADDEVAFGRWAADQIAAAIEMEGPDTVAAVFLEPVQNSGGCFPPPPGYFARVREICDRYDSPTRSSARSAGSGTCSARSATATSRTSSPVQRASPPGTPRSARCW